MKDRRNFIKTMAAGAGALTLTETVSAQSTGQVPAVSFLLGDSGVVLEGASSATSFVTTYSTVTSEAASSSAVAVGIDAV